jgi:hypothetical protein
MIKALRMHPQPRKRSSPKKKKQGNQGASASHKAPWAEEAKEAGAAAADVGVEAKSWPPPLQADVEKAPSIMLSAAAAAAEGDPSSALRFTACFTTAFSPPLLLLPSLLLPSSRRKKPPSPALRFTTALTCLFYYCLSPPLSPLMEAQ